MFIYFYIRCFVFDADDIADAAIAATPPHDDIDILYFCRRYDAAARMMPCRLPAILYERVMACFYADVDATLRRCRHAFYDALQE